MDLIGSAAADRLIGSGHPLEDAGDWEGALRLYRQAIDVAPGYARAHMNAGNALAKLERFDDAIAAHRRAVECAPDSAQSRFNLGALLAARGEPAASERELLEAARLAPAMIEPRVALADVYERQQRHEEAAMQLGAAAAAAPGHAGVMLNFGAFWLRLGRPMEAFRCFQRAESIDPDLRGAESQLLFATNFHGDLSAREVADQHRTIGRRLVDRIGPAVTHWPSTREPERRLKIGYVSGDFGPHPVALFIRPVLQAHDRSGFEIYCYSNCTDESSIKETLRQRSDHWREIASLSDEEVMRQLADDRIDILVDLSGHTNRERLSIFARHPAPVQVTWLGYLNTTGLPTMDYRITDAQTDPEGTSEPLHTERLVRMPHSQWCYFAWHDIDLVTEPHPERPGRIVFGSFNQYAKLTDQTLALWARILERLPHAALVVFDAKHPINREWIRVRLERLGIASDRVELRGREPIRDYFAAIGNVDIALDTVPYNGATTTLDALWMGVPVVGLLGDRGIARGTYSILRTLELDELIAASEDDYVNTNLRLARDEPWRARLRKTLRPLLAKSPLMDSIGFTRALEARYRQMWRDWCATHPDDGAAVTA